MGAAPRAPAPGNAAPQRVALFTSRMEAGGIQRAFVTLARALLARGFAVDVLLGNARRGELLEEIPGEARVLELQAPWPLAALPVLALGGTARRVALGWIATRRPRPLRSVAPLARYLAREAPAALLASPTSAALAALWAARIANSPVRVVAREANTLSEQIASQREGYRALMPRAAAEWYPRAAGVVAVSNGVAEDFARLSGFPRERITTIHTPIDVARVRARAAEPAPEPWLAGDDGAPPVVLGVGRLVPAKDFATLVRAFALLQKEFPARLVLLGEGPERERLLALARELGVGEHVRLAGLAQNPFAYMARAAVLVSSSRYEGLSNVIREALACGCPVVATDCPSGSAEALGNGALGRLVPVGDPQAMCDAIAATLRAPAPTRDVGLRAAEAQFEADADRYVELLLGTSRRTAGV